MNFIRLFLLFSLSFVILSCSREQKNEEPAKELPKTFAFTETNAVVTVEEIQDADNSKRSLKGDFNLDGLTDIAIIRNDGDVHNEVDIFIQATAPAVNKNKETTSFFKGGTITRPDDGSIIGLASTAEGNMVDIIMLVSYTNRPNEMIHYKNDGTSFTELEF